MCGLIGRMLAFGGIAPAGCIAGWPVRAIVRALFWEPLAAPARAVPGRFVCVGPSRIGAAQRDGGIAQLARVGHRPSRVVDSVIAGPRLARGIARGRTWVRARSSPALGSREASLAAAHAWVRARSSPALGSHEASLAAAHGCGLGHRRLAVSREAWLAAALVARRHVRGSRGGGCHLAIIFIRSGCSVSSGGGSSEGGSQCRSPLSARCSDSLLRALILRGSCSRCGCFALTASWPPAHAWLRLLELFECLLVRPSAVRGPGRRRARRPRRACGALSLRLARCAASCAGHLSPSS